MKPAIRIRKSLLNNAESFRAEVRRQMVLAGLYHEARMYECYCMDDHTNPISEALKYIEVEIDDRN